MTLPSCPPPFCGGHLFWSYRLAKLEVAAERRGVGRLSFARFEQDLGDRLRSLAAHTGSPEELFRGVDPGLVWVRPKAIERADATREGSSAVTMPERAQDQLIAKMTVRVLLEPSPEFATSEIIWLRAFGPALDAMLSSCCVGNRLSVRDDPPAIPLAGRRAYQYWFPAFRRFRDRAIAVAKRCLISGSRRCLLSTLDFASYYDSIDPSFLIRPEFIADVAARAGANGVAFDRVAYVQATEGLLGAYSRYWSKVGSVVGVRHGKGIPIGSLTARTVSNLALAELDRHVMSLPRVRYYARYVDDILVVEQPEVGEACPAEQAVSRLVPLEPRPTVESGYVLDSGALQRQGSDFIVQRNKLRLFDLEGVQGREYLGAVEAEIRRVSSAQRRFLEPWGEQLDQSVMASPGAEPIRALREADSLRLRRFAVGTVADKVATAASMLDRAEARRFSRDYLGHAGRLATDWSRWVDMIDMSLRVLGSALLSGDAETANDVVERLLARAADLDEDNDGTFTVRWGSSDLSSERARKKLREWVEEQLIEVVCAATPFDDRGFKVEGLAALAKGMPLRGQTLGRGALLARAKLLAAADLRLADRETDESIGTLRSAASTRRTLGLENDLAEDVEYVRRAPLVDRFLDACRALSDPTYGGVRAVELMLMVQPPTHTDVLFRWLRAERDVSVVDDLVNAIRGTRNQGTTMVREADELRVASPGGVAGPRGAVGTTRVILANLCTDEEWGIRSLTNPVLTIERAVRVVRVLNHASHAARRAGGRPTLLVLPELSLPRRWVRQVCAYLTRVGRAQPAVSLVAGLEYDVIGKQAFNEAIAFLPRRYFSAAGWIWTKRRPAQHESAELVNCKHSFATRGGSSRFTVMVSEHGKFIPLICSELFEVDSRAQLLRAIDLLIVPAWNRDTTSFESLVQSAALELHCFVAVANNGVYSDCRVRAPFSEAWQREVCRLISRGENEIVSADLQIGRLREYRHDPDGYEERRKRWIKWAACTGEGARCPWPAWKPAPPADAWPVFEGWD